MTKPESKSIQILMITSDRLSFSKLVSAFENQGNILLSWVDTGTEGLKKISENAFHLVITDEKLNDMTGLEFAGRMVEVNPMMNCTAVSSLSPEEFHEASEGLGLLMPLPPNPGEEDAVNLLKSLDQILTMTMNVQRN